MCDCFCDQCPKYNEQDLMKMILTRNLFDVIRTSDSMKIKEACLTKDFDVSKGRITLTTIGGYVMDIECTVTKK